MAGRRKYRSAGKSAYKMTARRKAALRNAQLISARKRRKGHAVKVGILASGVAIGVLGHKHGGSVANMAKDLKNRHFRHSDPANTKAHVVAQDVKEAVVKTNAVSPASAARHAPPVQSPNMHNTSTPAPSRHNGPAAKGVPGFGGIAQNPKSVQNLPQAESIIDPQKPVRPPFPAEHLPTKERILGKLGKDAGDVNQDDLWALSQIWDNHLRQQGVRVKGHKNRRVGVYTSMLDMFDLEPKSKAKKA